MAVEAPKFPLMRRLVGASVRAVLVAVIVIAAGLGIGQALGVGVKMIPDFGGGAPSIDHFVLAGNFDHAAALVAPGDLPATWIQGQPFFGLIGGGFCGKAPEVQGAKSEKRQPVTWTDQASGAVIVSEVVSVDRARYASSYITDVAEAYADCERYFEADEAGTQIEYDVSMPGRKAPVSDYVSRVIQPKDRSFYQEITLFQVGDAIVAYQYRASTRPPKGVLEDMEKKILARVDPEQFATTTTTKGAKDLPADTTLVLAEDGLTDAIDGAAPTAATSPATLPTANTEPPPSSVPEAGEGGPTNQD